jgi:putative tryptophan/tyrosine transport system substrate-binding protein
VNWGIRKPQPRRYAAEGKLDRLPDLAAELVRLKVDVIVALYVPCALAAKQATQDIPIVIIAGDPVETGIVPSLAHAVLPGVPS